MQVARLKERAPERTRFTLTGMGAWRQRHDGINYKKWFDGCVYARPSIIAMRHPKRYTSHHLAGRASRAEESAHASSKTKVERHNGALHRLQRVVNSQRRFEQRTRYIEVQGDRLVRILLRRTRKGCVNLSECAYAWDDGVGLRASNSERSDDVSSERTARTSDLAHLLHVEQHSDEVIRSLLIEEIAKDYDTLAVPGRKGMACGRAVQQVRCEKGCA